MAFITDEEVTGLRIESMILHVVGDDAFAPQPAQRSSMRTFSLNGYGTPTSNQYSRSIHRLRPRLSLSG